MFLIDDSMTPVLLVISDGDCQVDDMKYLLEEWNKKAYGPNRFALILDATTAGKMNAMARKMLGEHQSQIKDIIAKTCILYSFCIANVAVRGLLSAVTWVSPLPVKTSIKSTVEAGIVAVARELAAQGLLPSEAEAAAEMRARLGALRQRAVGEKRSA